MVSVFIASKLRVEKNLDTSKVQISEGDNRRVASVTDYKIILERNVFDSRDLTPEVQTESAPTQIDPNAPAVKTSLPIKLLSTFVVGPGTDSRSSATITGGQGAQADIYSIGDTKVFAQGTALTKIFPSRIEFTNGGRLEFAEIEQFGGGVTTTQPISALDKPAAPAPGGPETVKEVQQGKFVVERAELDASLANIDQLFTQIVARPQITNGKTTGLKLVSIKGGSLFSKLGLKRNDVLERINGQEVDLKKGMELFGTLKDSNRISIDLVRNGQKTTLEYDIQ